MSTREKHWAVTMMFCVGMALVWAFGLSGGRGLTPSPAPAPRAQVAAPMAAPTARPTLVPTVRPTEIPPSRPTAVPTLVPAPSAQPRDGSSLILAGARMSREGYVYIPALGNESPTPSVYSVSGLLEDDRLFEAMSYLWILLPESRSLIDDNFRLRIRLKFVPSGASNGIAALAPDTRRITVLNFGDSFQSSAQPGVLIAIMARALYHGSRQGYPDWPSWLSDEEQAYVRMLKAWQALPPDLKPYPEGAALDEWVRRWQQGQLRDTILRDPSYKDFPGVGSKVPRIN